MKQKYLLIVESSSKCGAIEKYLGPEYKCIASNGHIRVLADGLKSIDTKNGYEPRYSIDPDKKAHVQKMAAIISEFDKANIIIATDHDREGEAIGWHICQVFDLPVDTCRRIVFHEITKPALQQAIKNPGTINMNLVYAAIARQVLDVLVGYKVSPLLWKYVAQGTGLSAGRCQTPALRLVAETESGDQPSCVKHRIKGCFFPPHNITMELDTEFDTELEVLDYLNVSSYSGTIGSSSKFTFELGAKKVSERSAPKPLNTSAVLQLASNMLHMGAKETMACCQTLYQLGHITYMRTDNRTYSPEFIATCSKYITDNWSEKHVGSVLPVNTDANCPHEAIRVTNVQLKDLVLVADHNTKGIEKLYKLIWLNTVQSCMANATYNVYPLTVHGPLGYKFKHGLETAVFLGHKVLDNIKPESSATTVQSLILKMQTTANKEATYTYLESSPHLSVGHRHYTEAGLISKLEELGIGRPSTYSTIIDTILTRKYVEKTDVPGTTVGCNVYTLRPSEEVSVASVQKTFGAERGKLVLEPVGKIVVDFLVDKFAELFSYDFTRNMEEQLDQVAAGTLQWQKVCDECNKKIKSITKLEKKVYRVDDTWSLMFSKNGPALYNKGSKEFQSVKRGLKLNIEALEQGKYTFDDLAQIEERVINEVTTVKCGKFGLYAEIAKEDGTVDNVSLQHLKKPIEDIVLEDIPVKEVTASGPKTVLRTLTPSLSIRNGKYGPYIYYQTPKMKKPKFYDLKGFNQGFGVCDADELVAWIQHKYGAA